MSIYNKIVDLQKLQNAWRQVYKNKPEEGVDSVTCEAFEEDKKSQLKLLWHELLDHSYECMPVQVFSIYKGEKVRVISLYTMRDKVVQCSVARELSLIYETSLSNCCYAYRNGKSAQLAAQAIEHKVLDGKQGVVLKADIHSFFDCIIHEKLLQVLRERIREEDVLELIRKIIKAPAIEKSGELREKTRGVYQGAAVSPVLSNIYMMKLDRLIEKETTFYVRYSDDMLLFFTDKKEAECYQKKLAVYLEELGLELNEDKTQIVLLENGFEFLGYRFDKNGMSIPEKAENQLTERLEKVWLDSSCQTLQERLEKGTEILGGWEQYFKGERLVHSILEYAVWVYQMQKKGKLNLEKVKEARGNFINPYKDVMMFLASVWKEAEMAGMELEEYEQYYSLYQLDIGILPDSDSLLLQELVELYRKYTIQETEEIRAELIQIYADLKMYQKAAALEERFRKNNREPSSVKLIQASPNEEESIALSSEELMRYMELFTGREDVYALDTLSERNV